MCVKPFKVHDLIPGMLKERIAYITACKNFTPTTTHDRKGEEGTGNEDAFVGAYTKEILGFWADQSVEFPTWAKAAQIVFALTPNSASCERVFSCLARVFGKDRDSTLGDQIEAALMLTYNKRSIG